VVALALCATTVGCGAAGKSGETKSGAAGKSGETKSGAAGKTFSGELCRPLSSSELAAAHIDAPCVQAKTEYAPFRNLYSAHWAANAQAHKLHSLAVSLKEFKGPSASARLEHYRRKLQPGGQPFYLKKGIGSLETETFNTVDPSAPPPKNGAIPALVAHKQGEARFVVGNYLGMIVLDDDSASEKDLEQALIRITQTLAAEL
jgi:hypothetical protein